MPTRARPTSPHLEIYRWEIGMSLSILHRVTGGFLALGLIELAYWLVALAGGPDSYAAASRLIGNPVGVLLLVGFTFAFLFHLMNGVRHLVWDAGRGFEKVQRRGGGWFVISAALLLTVVLWICIWRHLS
jgi:succinate dehydrogenase / fumarate reductase, cytochrome b subunit